jgi:hypothetical protein
MVTSENVKVDGKYRPERWFDSQWHVAMYHEFRGTVHRVVHSETYRGQTYAQSFGCKHDAQKLCDILNHS